MNGDMMHPLFCAGQTSWKTLFCGFPVYNCNIFKLKIICTILLISGATVSLPQNCYSGNKWMMERNKQELLMLNSKLLKHLSSIKKNGEIILKGSVIYRDGKTILKIQEMQNFSSASGKNPSKNNFPKEGEDYQLFLREDVITEIPIDTEEKPDNKVNMP